MKLRDTYVLPVIAQAALYAIRMVAVWIFLRGHQEPGGGFVAGLVVAATVAVHGLAFGRQSAASVFPLSVPTLLGLGLTCAFGTVFLPILFGYPFMRHFFGHLSVPLLGDLEWATAAVFDLGVFLVVVGAAKSILLHIAGDRTSDDPPNSAAGTGAPSGGGS